ncbi:hypothetical protein ACLB2K_019852 [Fragaria x ananassa]
MNSTIYNPTKSHHPSSQFPQIKTCKTLKDLQQVHAHFIKTRQIHDPLAAAEVLRFYALSSHRNVDYARAVFSQIQTPNCFSWNTIIRALAESSDPEHSIEALILFHRMVCDGLVASNNLTFPSVLKACSKIGNARVGKSVHGMVVKLGLESDEFVVSSLVRMYVMNGVMEDAHLLFSRSIGDCGGLSEKKKKGNVVLWNLIVDGHARLGEFSAARELFDKMPQRSVVSWNAMISAYVQNGFFREAVEMFRDMQIGDVLPNYVTLVSVLPVIAPLGVLDLGEWVHLYAGKHRIGIDDVLGSALVDMHYKCGSIEKALLVFEQLPKKNVITWNAIISGLCMHARGKDALDCFSKMERAGVVPSDVTYIGLLSACSHGGMVEQGRSLFNHMINLVGLEPRIEHYGCMVDLLGRAGLLEEAEELIQNMPIQPDDVIWKALLGACKVHRNIGMGKRIVEILMDLAPRDSGSYVALSNMYAPLGNWEAVSNVRMLMKDMDIRKDPGGSWIELDG